jgi:soluble lytic murein transglycosylase-like protein
MSIIGNWKKLVMGHTLCFGGGSSGGGGSTQQSSQYTNLTPWAQPYVSSILGAGQQQVFDVSKDESGNQTINGIRPYNAYGSFNDQGGQYGINPSAQAAANAAVAGFQPLQNQAYQGASNLSQSMAPGITGGAALGSLYAGQNLANQSTDPNAVNAYMNPYIQNALNPALSLLNQQYGIAGQQQQGQATRSGAFGGTRASLERGLNQQNQMLAQNQLVGNAYNQAYGNAQNQMNTVANLGLQGYGQAGSLAGQQLQQQQGILGLQNQFGGQQQQQQQNVINAGMANYQQAQQYPMQQLGQLKGLLAGIPVTDVTTTQEQAQPSAVSQLAGLGTAGVAGLALANQASKAEGGMIQSYAEGGSVKGYAPGGIAAINRKALLNPTSISPKQLQASTKDGVIAQPVSGIAQAIQLNEKVHGDAAAASAKGMPQGTIIDELRAQAAQKDEQEAMAEAIPKAIEVLKQKMETALQVGDTESVQRYAQEIQQLVAMIQPPQQQEQAAPSAPAPSGIEQLAANGGQPPEQGIEAAQSNLPAQAMAEGGIIGYASRGYVDEDERYTSKEEEDDAEMAALYGSGSENDFVQSIMPAARQSGTASPSAAINVSFEPKAQSSEFTATRKGSHKYENEIISAAEKVGLPKEIAIHAAFKETGNLRNPETARSRAGAIGVMQLMPGTARELGVDPYNPQENIMGGVAYLKKLYDKYQDPQLTLMAYNAGPGRLDRALKSEKGISSLPQETLAYRMAAGGAIKGYAGDDNQSLVTSDAQDQGIKTIPQATKLTPLEALQEEIVQDYRARKEAAKSTRETNNLLSIMQAGLGTAASKNIHPLGAIAEGGQQGISTLATLRKQEADESKDLAATQLGLYKYKSAAEARAAEAAALDRYRMANTAAKPDKDDIEAQRIEKALSTNPQLRDLRERMQLEAKNGTLTAELEAKYQAAINKITGSIYKNFGRDYKPVDIGAITPLPPPKEPSLWDRITGKGGSTNQGTPPLPPGYQIQ